LRAVKGGQFDTIVFKPELEERFVVVGCVRDRLLSNEDRTEAGVGFVLDVSISAGRNTDVPEAD